MTALLWLHSLCPDPTLVGSKAATLARLYQAGFAVPDGVVLPVPSAGCSEADLEAGLTTIAAPLGAAIQQLCPNGQLLAVRSSAIAEDREQQSFAGQFRTLLNVPPAEIKQAIFQVWRSADTPAMQVYRQQQGLPKTARFPAILLQPMVAAQVAGVAFGADPITGRRDMVVISATEGLAEALVSGRESGQTWEVDRNEQIRAVNHAAELPLLQPAQVREIAALTRRLGLWGDCPQDVEWAIADDRLYLLQSRPITTLGHTPDPAGAFCLWDNSNIGESYQGVTTPLTFSFARRAYEEVYRQFCRLMGVSQDRLDRHQSVFRCMIGLLHGRIYYNLLNWYRVLALLPAARLNARFMEQMMGVKQALPDAIVAELQQSQRGYPLQDFWQLLRTLVGLGVNYFTLPWRIRRYTDRLTQVLQPAADRPQDWSLWSLEELLDHYRQVEQKLLPHWDAPIVNDFFAMIFYGLLRRLTETWWGDRRGTLHHQLIAFTGDVISTQPIRQLQQMANHLAPCSAAIEIFCQGNQRQIQEWLISQPDLAQQIQRYLEQFGDRCLEELKLESPSLWDDPLPLYRTIGHLATHSPTQPREAINPLSVQPETPLSLPQRWCFQWVVANARRLIRNRENLRFERTRVFGQARRIFREVGRRLYASGWLTQASDVFYLEIEEIFGLVEGWGSTADLKGLVDLRRREFDRYRQQSTPPNRLTTQGIPMAKQAPPPRQAFEPMTVAMDVALCRQGVGCAPGCIEGIVWKVETSRPIWQDALTSLPRGEEVILVAETTDPGWVLLFPHIAGLLVERASVLSHAAIVARELSLPMVSALPNLTTWLQTGDRVRIDGSQGTVMVLQADDMK